MYTLLFFQQTQKQYNKKNTVNLKTKKLYRTPAFIFTVLLYVHNIKQKSESKVYLCFFSK